MAARRRNQRGPRSSRPQPTDVVAKLVSDAMPAADPVLNGIWVLVRLHQVVDAQAPDWARAAQILAGIYRMARRDLIPDADVLAGPLGRPASEAVHCVWPLVRALSTIEVFTRSGTSAEPGDATFELMDSESAKVLQETGALVLLQAMGPVGVALWRELAARAIKKSEKHGIGLGELFESLGNRPIDWTKYRPQAEVANIVAFVQAVARSHLADANLAASPVVQHLGIAPRTVRRIAKEEGVSPSDLEGVEAALQRRLLAQRHQVEGRLTQRQLARGFGIPEATMRLVMKRVRDAGHSPGTLLGRNRTYDAADVAIIRPYVNK